MDDSSGLHRSASVLWMTKYGAACVLLGDCSRVWQMKV